MRWRRILQLVAMAAMVSLCASGLTVTADSVAASTPPSPCGLWIAWSDGFVESHFGCVNYGDMSAARLNAPIVGMAATPSHHGYWLVGRDGGIFSFGDASF